MLCLRVGIDVEVASLVLICQIIWCVVTQDRKVVCVFVASKVKGLNDVLRSREYCLMCVTVSGAARQCLYLLDSDLSVFVR
jgi:hypothetical protein